MRFIKKDKNQTGDTIVEVLFAITVLAVVLSSTYAIANKSITTSRLNYERNQAVKYAEGQIELIKTFSATKPKTEFLTWRSTGMDGSRCINTSDPNLGLISGSACSREGKFTITVSYVNTGLEQTSYFTSKVVWDTADPNGAKKVELLYRVHDENER